MIGQVAGADQPRMLSGLLYPRHSSGQAAELPWHEREKIESTTTNCQRDRQSRSIRLHPGQVL